MLIKNIDDLRKYIPVSKNFDLKDLQPALDNEAEPLIAEVIGDELLKEISDKIDAAEGSLNGKYIKLVDYIRYAATQYALLVHLPSSRVQLTDGGMVVTITDNTRSASAEQFTSLALQLERNVSKGIERLYKYLEDNKADYDKWTTSNAFTVQRANFINSASEYSSYVFINSNRSVFVRLRPIMTDVEDDCILPLLGQPLFNEIKTQVKVGNLSVNNAKIFPFIRRAAAKGTMFKAIDSLDLKFTSDGIQLSYLTSDLGKQIATPADKERLSNYKSNCEAERDSALKKLTDFLNGNHTDFPLYDYEESDSTTTDPLSINKAGNGIFMG